MEKLPHLMKFYESDEVKVKEDKIKSLFFSNPIYLKEEGELTNPESFLKRTTGRVLECDWDRRRELWTHFVSFIDKKTQKEIRLWFLETELLLI